MTAARSEDRRARDSARDGSAMLQTLLLSVAKLGAAGPAKAVAARLKVALAAMTKLETSGVREQGFFDQLDAARDELKAVVQELAQLGEDSPASALRPAAERALTQLARCSELGLQAIAAGRRGDASSTAGSERPTFRASRGIPSLHALARSALEPPLSPAERDHLSWMATDCLSEIAALSNLRVSLPNAPWSNAAPFERRLLATLDALICLGTPPTPDSPTGWNVLEGVQRYGSDSYVPDSGRQFTRALCLCCVEGADTVRAALTALRQAPPQTYAAIRDALSLCPNPAVEPEIDELCRECEPELVPVLLEVLRHRREASMATVMRQSAHPSDSVRQAVARALAYAEPADRAISTLQGMLAEHGDEALNLAAATSLLTRGQAITLGFIRDKLANSSSLTEDVRHGYLQLIALAGAAEDAPLMKDALGDSPRDAELAGWYGHSGMVDQLLVALERANDLRKSTGHWPAPAELAIADALYRITGAPIHDEPTDGVSYDFESRPALSARTWNRWWTKHGDRFDPVRRYRFGAPYHPAATVSELLDDATPARLRADLTVELAFAVGPNPFEPTDWVAGQRAVLSGLQQRLQAAKTPYPAGAFLADHLCRHSSYVG